MIDRKNVKTIIAMFDIIKQFFTEEVFGNRLKKLTVYGRVNLNTFAGRTTTQIFIDDYDLENPPENLHKYDFF